MVRQILAVVTLLCLPMPDMRAQVYTGVEPGSRGWVTQPSFKLAEASNGYETCGRLFRYMPPRWKTGEAYLAFNFDDESRGNTIASKVIPWSTDKFRVRLLGSHVDNPPFIEVVRMNTEETPWVIIVISPKEYSHAPCLKNIAPLVEK